MRRTRPRRSPLVLGAGVLPVVTVGVLLNACGPRPALSQVAHEHGTAYVADSGSYTITPINLATERSGAPIPAGSSPSALAASPDGKTIYAVNYATSMLAVFCLIRGSTIL